MPPQDGQAEPLKKMTKILNSLISRPESMPFLEPVDWRGLELWDYPQVVKKLMDLGTIQRKLERQQYETAAQVAADIRLVWKNCMLYNAEGSDFYLLAKSLSKRFEDRYRKVKTQFYVGEEEEEEEEEDEEETSEDEDELEEEEEMQEPSPKSSSRTSTSSSAAMVPLDAKTKLAADLLLLNGVELAEVVTMIELKCPQALISPDTGTTTTTMTHTLLPDTMELDVDALDADTLSKLKTLAASKAKARRGGGNNIAITDISNKRKRKR